MIKIKVLTLVFVVSLIDLAACQDQNIQHPHPHPHHNPNPHNPHPHPHPPIPRPHNHNPHDPNSQNSNPAMFNRRHANREDSNRQTSYHGNIRNLRYENVNDGSGNFQYYFVNDDGTSVFQRGFLKAPEVSGEEPSQAQMGYYEYISSEGKKIRVEYIADKYGYRINPKPNMGTGATAQPALD